MCRSFCRSEQTFDDVGPLAVRPALGNAEGPANRSVLNRPFDWEALKLLG